MMLAKLAAARGPVAAAVAVSLAAVVVVDLVAAHGLVAKVVVLVAELELVALLALLLGGIEDIVIVIVRGIEEKLGSCLEAGGACPRIVAFRSTPA